VDLYWRCAQLPELVRSISSTCDGLYQVAHSNHSSQLIPEVQVHTGHGFAFVIIACILFCFLGYDIMQAGVFTLVIELETLGPHLPHYTVS
jgi:hypothetical protein